MNAWDCPAPVLIQDVREQPATRHRAVLPPLTVTHNDEGVVEGLQTVVVKLVLDNLTNVEHLSATAGGVHGPLHVVLVGADVLPVGAG